MSLFLDQLAETLRREQDTSARPTSEEIGEGRGAARRRAAARGLHRRPGRARLRRRLPGGDGAGHRARDPDLDRRVPHPQSLPRRGHRARPSPSTAASARWSLADRGTERLGFFAHELRNLLANAMLAFDILKSGTVGRRRQHGRDARTQPDRAARPHRPLAGRGAPRSAGSIAGSSSRSPSSWKRSRWRPRSRPRPGASSSRSRRSRPGVVIDVDRQLIAAALANLLQNAFKFSRPERPHRPPDRYRHRRRAAC